MKTVPNLTIRAVVAACAFATLAALAVGTSVPAGNGVTATGSTPTRSAVTMTVTSPLGGVWAADTEASVRQPPVIPVVADRLPPDAQATTTTVPVELTVTERICVVFGEECERAIRIAWCESRHLPDAEGLAKERGIFQIHPVHKSWIGDHGYSWDDMFEVDANIAIAKILYDSQGWGPWTCTG